MKRFSILAILYMLIISACHNEEHLNNEKTKYLVSAVLKADTTVYKEYVCQINSIQHIELRALEKGYLQNIYIDEGQFVKKGQKLFQIMPILYQAELQKADAEVKFAEIEYLNTKKLADKNIVSENELALSKAKLEKAKAEQAVASAHLSFTEIKAPFDGYVDRFHVRLGSLVDEGELLSSMSDNSKMWVYFNVPESEYLEYQNQKNKNTLGNVKLLMANNKEFKYPGKVETIEADFNNETGNIAFRATFPNPDALLRHGETGNILMPTELKNALLIPQKASFEILDKKYVYVIDKENRVQSREIEVGHELPHIYEVVAGLKEGDKILIEGLRKVKNNEKIEYDLESPVKVFKELNELHAE